MSGECIYYSLRPNKFVERYLFVELLQKSIRDFSSDDYVYVSLGGPQLEDHHLINCKLGIKNLLSLEKSHSIITRQEYNKRRADIKCNEIDASEFINNFSTHISCYSGKKFIIWLDFSSPNERYEQLSELEALLKNYTFGDVVKITMNANARTLGIHKEGWSTDDLYRHRREKVQQQLGEYLPSLGVEKINKDTFPIILSQAIKNAALRGLDNTLNETVLPLGIFLYNDGNHQMITVTMIVINLDDVDNYRDWLGTNGWDFVPSSSRDICRINVPFLTAKERLCIEEKMADPNIIADEIIETLPFQLDDDREVSATMIKEYVRHSCRYPSFYQVII